MPRLRPMAFVALAIVWPSLGLGFGCDTHAVGVDDCRTIEKARCAAAHSCTDLGIDASNEAECERFARDNCLHGLPTEAPPTAGELDRCVKAIQAAGACADVSSEGPGYSGVKCTQVGGVTLATASVCDVIESPEDAVACSFLLAVPKPAVVVDAGTKD